MSKATFFLSTGRSGTQWLHRAIAQSLDRLVASVHHEPLAGYEYKYLSTLDTVEEIPQHSPSKRHMDSIIDCLERDCCYVETGYPSFWALESLHNWIPGGIQVVWISREPVSLAQSWFNHGLYAPIFLPHQTPKTPLSPDDGFGVHAEFFREQWPHMDQIQKILYFWTEIHTYGRDLYETQKIPTIHLRFEDLFTPHSLAQMIDYVCPGETTIDTPDIYAKVDQYGWEGTFSLHENILDSMPVASQLAENIGYSILI